MGSSRATGTARTEGTCRTARSHGPAGTPGGNRTSGTAGAKRRTGSGGHHTVFFRNRDFNWNKVGRRGRISGLHRLRRILCFPKFLGESDKFGAGKH